MMRALGIDSYRFSVVWSRILPNGLADRVSEAGIAYYNNVIDEVLKYNIQPMITLYHWDLPQKLQDMGGFLNPLIVDWFADYARVVFDNFGDRVKTFITFNEAAQVCHDGYGSVTKALMLNITDVGEFICAKNLILAHAKAYHVYNDEFKPVRGGSCGFAIAVGAAQPIVDSEEVLHAVELFNQFQQMPKSLYIALNEMQKRYGDIPIYVTENGWSTREGIEDDERVDYYRDALEDVLVALDEGIDVRGYYAWSLMDNFEWLAGYTKSFGFYEINFADPELTRIPRKSAFIYKQIIKTREIVYDYQPESYVMSIDAGH